MQPCPLQRPRPARPHVLRCSLAPPTLRRRAPAFKAARSSRRLSLPPLQHQGGRVRGHPAPHASNGAGPEPEAGPAGQPPPDVEALWEDALKQFKEQFGVGDLEEELDAAERGEDDAAMEALQMGTWRLRDEVVMPIQALVSQIEDAWREILPDLGLYPLDAGWKYMDSLDPENKTPFAYQMLKSPEKGEPGWPRLQVENRVYQSRAFRKLHLEVAVRQDGLQVLHCVMYPRLEFDLPILSLDLVASSGRVTLAIIDPCPVSTSLQLPPHYLQGVRELLERYSLSNNRSVPDWGAAIFSAECVILRPTESAQVAEFLRYAIALSRFHVQLGRIANPVGVQRAARLREMHAAHQRYRDKQLENDKTRQVLAKAFGGERAEEYMRVVMFDVEDLPAEAAA